MGRSTLPVGYVYTPKRMGHQGIYIGQHYLALEIFENKLCPHLQAVNTRVKVRKHIRNKYKIKLKTTWHCALPDKIETEACYQCIHTSHWAQT